MKLSNKGRYAVRALFDIAFYSQGRATQVRDISERQQIPPRFLEQIFQDLKKARIVGSKRGPNGGYNLVRGPESVTLGDVIRAIEGPIAIANESKSKLTGRNSDGVRVTEAVFSDLSTKLEACFDGVSIADICARAERLGARKPGQGRYAYVI